MKKILPALAAILAAILFLNRGGGVDPGSLAASFYRRLFREEAARAVFGVEEEEVTAVFGAEDAPADPI